MSNVNKNIRNFRKFRGLSQKELGDALHKSTNVVSNWENGIHSPDLDTIEDICKILNVSPDELFGWKENKEYAEFMQRIDQWQQRIDELQHQKLSIEKEIHELETLKFNSFPPLDEEVPSKSLNKPGKARYRGPLPENYHIGSNKG